MPKRHTRQADGKFHIDGKKYELNTGSRAQVYHETAYKTTGGLRKKDLMKNKHGRIVSAKKHATAKREKRLVKHGYTAKKGKFGAVKLGRSHSPAKSRKRKTAKRRKSVGGSKKRHH